MAKTAVINENECIGCTKCIQACPFDAIIGAQKQMHTVLRTECTGCELCVDPCPVDCIEMVDIPAPLYDREKIKQRKKARLERLQKETHKFAEIPGDKNAAKELLRRLLK